jgi:hypothetical protein
MAVPEMKIRFLAIIAAMVTFAGLGAGIAYASIPGPDGVIHACYKPSDGKLFTIDSSASCPSGTTALNWNQAGAQGPAGPTGPQGPAGPGATSSVVTRDVSYSPPGGTGSFTDIQTVDCTAGTHAVNGGIVQTTASTAWQAAIAAGGTGNSGQAITQEAAETNDTGGGGPNTTDPVNPSLPRSVNSGGSWKMELTGFFPQVNGIDYGITVTLYAVCL